VTSGSNVLGTDPVRTAVRFPLRMEIVIATEGREYRAITEDVSSNGVLFSAEELPPVGSNIEFRLTMPAAVMGSSEDVLLHCVGRVVRQELTRGSHKAAAVIDEYSLKAEHL
jgi:hypothetical protein